MVLRYKSVSETKKWIKKICFFTLTIFRRCKFQNSPLIEKISLIFLCTTLRHFSSPISTVVEGRRGLVSTNNSKTRPIISDSHHDRTIFPRGMAGQRYSRYYRGAIESRYLVHGPLSVLSGVVAAPFWQRDASGGPDTRELEKPAAHFRADNAVIDKLCGPGGGVESIRGRWRPCHRDPARFIVCFVFCNFYFEIAFFCVLYFVIWLTKHSKRYD